MAEALWNLCEDPVTCKKIKGTILKERMNIVIAGHVDHGKSTLIGRLLVDTNSLPEGKLEQIKKDNFMITKPERQLKFKKDH